MKNLLIALLVTSPLLLAGCSDNETSSNKETKEEQQAEWKKMTEQGENKPEHGW